jgi:hypothetical protein
MPRMLRLDRLNEIFFRAEKKYFAPINKFTVEGFPGTRIDPIHYAAKETDWKFRTYKEAVFAGLIWTRKLFNAPLTDLRINHFEFGKKKQWFNVQIVKTGDGILIDGERYNPFINISYSYNTVNSIKFEIGFYRFACENGVVNGHKELTKLKITPENLFDIPFWLNPCLILFLSGRYENQIKVLKRTSIKGEDIREFINQKFKTWKISDRLIERYIHEMDSTGFALLNILTDSASNFSEEENVYIDNVSFLDSNLHDTTSNSERANRQRKVGQFLEKLVEEIERENEVKSKIDINSPEFDLSTENINLLEAKLFIENYKFNLLKMKY